MAVVSTVVRYCMRHPVRILFISLLVLLVIASRFIYSSVPEQQHVHELNIMAGGLSQHVSHRKLSDPKIKKAKERVYRPILPVKHADNSAVKQTTVGESDSTYKGKEEEKDLSQEASERIENSIAKESIITIEDSDERAENDLNRRKVPDNERLRENAGKLSPFEVAEKAEKFSGRKISREEMIQNREAQHENLTVKKGVQRKKSKNRSPQSPQLENNILMTLAKVGQTSPLAKRFRRCVQSLCEHSTISLTFHIICDKLGKLTSQDAFNQAGKVCKFGLNVTYYEVSEVVNNVQPFIKEIQSFFKSGDPNDYYNDPLFFVSTAIHHALPQNMMRIMSLDSDLFFQADIKHLFAEFDSFKSTNIFGLAREQQPVYRHVLHMFRNRNPGTKVGGPPPDGLTGFNSGVVLFNLHNMRGSKLYQNLLNGNIIKEMAKKYTFQGHLGDQDFYSLLSLDYPELFHVLPCSWNRQLCTYWRDKGYAEVFDSYFNCSEPIHVYHGNCGSEMPNE